MSSALRLARGTATLWEGVMPLWNSSKKEPETVTMEKACGSKPVCPDGGGEPRDIRRAYEFKEVLGTYVSFYTMFGTAGS